MWHSLKVHHAAIVSTGCPPAVVHDLYIIECNQLSYRDTAREVGLLQLEMHYRSHWDVGRCTGAPRETYSIQIFQQGIGYGQGCRLEQQVGLSATIAYYIFYGLKGRALEVKGVGLAIFQAEDEVLSWTGCIYDVPSGF